MKKIFNQTETGIKYLLYVSFSFTGLLSTGFMLIAPNVWDDMVIFFFIPYIPLITSLVVCWDIIAEEEIKHKVLGICSSLFSCLLIFWTWAKVGIPF